MVAARRDARSRAAASGLLCDPALVWYTLHDSAGRLLHRSTPRLVAAPGGSAAVTAAVGLTSGSGYNQLPALEVKVAAWRLRVSLPSAQSAAAMLRLHCAPLADTVGRDTRVIATFGDHSATAGTLTLRFPLAAAGSADAVAARIDTLHSGAVTLLSLPAPFTGAPAVLKAGGPGTPCLDAASSDGLAGECAPPHNFRSSVSALAGDLAIHGDITPLRALPAGVLWAGESREAAVAWTAVTRVTLLHPGGREEVVSVSQSGGGGCPSALSPLLVYPHPAAVRMEIGVAGSDGSRRGVTVDLVPTPSGRAACYVEPGLQPIELVDISALPAPLVRRVELRRPSALLVAPAGSPRLPSGALDALEGAVTAAAQAGPATSSLDFGRRHLHVFTAAGIYLVAVRGAGEMSARRLDARVVTSPQLVAPAPEGNYAVASGELLLVSSAKVTRLDTVPGLCVALGREPRRGTLLLLDADGTLTARYPTGGVSRLSTPPGLSGFRALPGRLLGLRDDDTLGYDFSAPEDADEPMPVEVALRMAVAPSAPLMRRLPSAIEWDIASTSANLRLGLEGRNGASAPVRVVSAGVSGAVTVPPRVRVLPCRPLARLRLTLAGSAALSTEIRSVTLLR